jgi:CBS domain-containing protein
LLHFIFESEFNYLNEPDRDGFEISVKNEFNDLKEAIDNYNGWLWAIDNDYMLVKYENDIEIIKSSFKKNIPKKDIKESIQNYKVNIMKELLISKYIDSSCLIPYAKDLIFADTKSTMSEIKDLLINNNVGTIPIIENNKCIGIIKRKYLWEWDYKNFGKKAKLLEIMSPATELKIVNESTALRETISIVNKDSLALFEINFMSLKLISSKCITHALYDLSSIFIKLYELENSLKKVIFDLRLSFEEIERIYARADIHSYHKNEEEVYEKMHLHAMNVIIGKRWDKIDLLKKYNKNHLMSQLNEIENIRNDVMHFRNFHKNEPLFKSIDQLISIFNL